MNSKPIFLNLGVIFVVIALVGFGGTMNQYLENDYDDTFVLSLEEACPIDKGKGLILDVATGGREHDALGCVWEEPEIERPAAADTGAKSGAIITSNTITASGSGKYVSKGLTQEGIASWYGANFHNGPTASGETYDMYSLTAAHRELPFNTMVRVTRLDDNRSVVVRINNRGPYIEGRIIDLSKKAAERIGMKGQGLAQVRIEVIELP